MRHIFGAFLTCLAVMGASACSDATPPAAEGNASVTLGGRHAAIYGPGGEPTSTSFGGTVLSGTNGVRLSCKVTHSGTYSVQAHIENADMIVDIASGDINTGAQMTFYQVGAAGSETSVDANSDPASTCTVTTSADNTIYVVKSGSIFAGFTCTNNVRTPQNIKPPDTATGIFLFTGCDK